jgi:hypothetical protein
MDLSCGTRSGGGGRGVEVPDAGDVFPLLSAVAPPKGEFGDWQVELG